MGGEHLAGHQSRLSHGERGQRERCDCHARLAIVSYLFAAVIANTAVSLFGPWALPFTALVIIPFDLAARDILHERWHGPGLWGRMFGLVLAGSVLSFLFAIPSVCVASSLAFASAGATNAIAYAILFRLPRLAKMNVSNVFAATADSVVFPLIAFGMFDWKLTATQATFKVVGGFVWSLLLLRYLRCFQ